MNRHFRVGGMGSRYLAVAVVHTCTDVVEGPQALAVR